MKRLLSIRVYYILEIDADGEEIGWGWEDHRGWNDRLYSNRFSAFFSALKG